VKISYQLSVIISLFAPSAVGWGICSNFE